MRAYTAARYRFEMTTNVIGLVLLLGSYADIYWIGSSVIGITSTSPHPVWIAAPLWLAWACLFVMWMLMPGNDFTLKGAIIFAPFWPLYPALLVAWGIWNRIQVPRTRRMLSLRPPIGWKPGGPLATCLL